MNTTQGKKRIGQGTFSTVYQETKDTVLIVSSDPVKECMSMGWFPNSRLFPKVERLDFDINSEGCSLYRMRYLDRPSSLKKSLTPKHWKLYKTLKAYFDCAWTPSNHDESFEVLKDHFKEALKGFPYERDILLEAVDALANYGADMWFEISLRNVAVRNGKLILLDCFFMRKKLAVILEKLRDKRKNRLTY